MAAFGLRPVGLGSAAAYSDAVHKYFVPSSDTNAYRVGDPVKSSGSASSNGIPAVVLATSAGNLRGAIVGFAPEGINANDTVDLNINYIPATKTRGYIVWVADDPNQVFEIYEDASPALAAADIGLNADLNWSLSPSAAWQPSACTLDNSTKAGTATLQMRILGLSEEVGNAFGKAGGALVRVKINAHELGSVGTAGV